MTFPKLTLSTLPNVQELQELSDWETKDATAIVCISVWQYAKALLELDNEGKFTPFMKKVVKELYFESTPLTADELKERLDQKDKIVVQGKHGLGGFAVDFLERLQKDFPSFQFPEPYTKTGNVYLQVLLDLMMDRKDGHIYFYLRSRFRAALAQCYGDDVIKGW